MTIDEKHPKDMDMTVAELLADVKTLPNTQTTILSYNERVLVELAQALGGALAKAVEHHEATAATLHVYMKRTVAAEAALAKAVKALKEIEDHPENSSGTSRSYGIGWAFWNVQNIARRARTATPETESDT